MCSKAAVICLCLLAFVAACAAKLHHRFAEQNYVSGAQDDYDRNVRQALDALNSGDFDNATANLGRALRIPRDEVPNYEPMILLSYSECKRGESKVAAAIAADAKCALDVDAGDLSCPMPGEDEDDFFDKGGTETCLMTMCGEMFLPYYPASNDLQKKRISELRKDLSFVIDECF